MRVATIVGLFCVAGALSGCGAVINMPMFRSDVPGRTVEFVSSNADSVLLDFGARPPGELSPADAIATAQCQIFNRRTAVLESLNSRSDGLIRATFLCKR